MFLKTCDIMSCEERILEDESDNIHVLCQLPEYVSCLRKEIIFHCNEPEAIMSLSPVMSMRQDCLVQDISVPRGVSREKDTSRRSLLDLMNKTVWEKCLTKI